MFCIHWCASFSRWLAHKPTTPCISLEKTQAVEKVTCGLLWPLLPGWHGFILYSYYSSPFEFRCYARRRQDLSSSVWWLLVHIYLSVMLVESHVRGENSYHQSCWAAFVASRDFSSKVLFSLLCKTTHTVCAQSSCLKPTWAAVWYCSLLLPHRWHQMSLLIFFFFPDWSNLEQDLLRKWESCGLKYEICFNKPLLTSISPREASKDNLWISSWLSLQEP